MSPACSQSPSLTSGMELGLDGYSLSNPRHTTNGTTEESTSHEHIPSTRHPPQRRRTAPGSTKSNALPFRPRPLPIFIPSIPHSLEKEIQDYEESYSLPSQMKPKSHSVCGSTPLDQSASATTPSERRRRLPPAPRSAGLPQRSESLKWKSSRIPRPLPSPPLYHDSSRPPSYSSLSPLTPNRSATFGINCAVPPLPKRPLSASVGVCTDQLPYDPPATTVLSPRSAMSSSTSLAGSVEPPSPRLPITPMSPIPMMHHEHYAGKFEKLVRHFGDIPPCDLVFQQPPQSTVEDIVIDIVVTAQKASTNTSQCPSAFPKRLRSPCSAPMESNVVETFSVHWVRVVGSKRIVDEEITGIVQALREL
ncbi:hypothetical protein BD410DRAFT_830577 [Rickenella mellea]|uniref:Uncharacterized protein n=1 Tax=Rickenella mellea TaxID=50990 RepID=A0A4Y7PWK9_9AGAM|nr:hypothetical protein BD410DRAFT_830577 [Rickenella mellea]